MNWCSTTYFARVCSVCVCVATSDSPASWSSINFIEDLHLTLVWSAGIVISLRLFAVMTLIYYFLCLCVTIHYGSRSRRYAVHTLHSYCRHTHLRSAGLFFPKCRIFCLDWSVCMRLETRIQTKNNPDKTDILPQKRITFVPSGLFCTTAGHYTVLYV